MENNHSVVTTAAQIVVKRSFVCRHESIGRLNTSCRCFTGPRLRNRQPDIMTGSRAISLATRTLSHRPSSSRPLLLVALLLSFLHESLARPNHLPRTSSTTTIIIIIIIILLHHPPPSSSSSSSSLSSSFIIHHSSFIIHHSSFIIHHSSFIIHHDSLNLRHPHLPAQHLRCHRHGTLPRVLCAVARQGAGEAVRGLCYCEGDECVY